MLSTRHTSAMKVSFDKPHHSQRFPTRAIVRCEGDSLPVALARVKLDGKAARVTQRLWGAALVDDGREPRDQWRLHAHSAVSTPQMQVQPAASCTCRAATTLTGRHARM